MKLSALVEILTLIYERLKDNDTEIYDQGSYCYEIRSSKFNGELWYDLQIIAYGLGFDVEVEYDNVPEQWGPYIALSRK